MQRSSSLVSMSNGSKLDELPTWDPQSEASKKEVAQDNLAASLVHLIPVVIIICANILLWFFSYPETNAVAISKPQIGDRKECKHWPVGELKLLNASSQ